MSSRKEEPGIILVHQREANSRMLAMALVVVLAEVPQGLGSRDTMTLTITCPKT